VTGTSGIEREVKLQATRRVGLDQLGGTPLERRTFTSTYHDTTDRLLARAGITLRRRLEHGRSDWQLKLPADGARREIGAPGGPAGPPAAIADLLPAFLHGRELVQLATLRTARDGVLVRSDTGIAEVVLDEVAVMEGLRVTQTFDEVEIELVAGDERALLAIERTLKRLGARRTDGRTKIARALGVDEGKLPKPRTDDERLRLFLAQRYVDLLAADPGVRLGADVEPVHDLRVAVRRLRAVLRAAPFIAPEWANRMREELDWLGASLGPLRDLDVLTVRLRQETNAFDDEDRAAFANAFVALSADHDAAGRTRWRRWTVSAISPSWTRSPERLRCSRPRRRWLRSRRESSAGSERRCVTSDPTPPTSSCTRLAYVRSVCATSRRSSATNASSGGRSSFRTSSASIRTPSSQNGDSASLRLAFPTPPSRWGA
jgi:inorganic triphosphatase YgiF